MSDDELAKDLGLLSALAIGMGTMIGAGIFVLPGVAAQEAGPVVVVSFVIGGAIAMVNALAVSELGTAMPKAGGGYYYINRGLGPLFGSISGMGDWMGLAFASAFYCIGFGGYLTELLTGTALALPTLEFGLFAVSDIQLGALVAGLLFVGINYIGAKETGGVQTVIVTVLLGILTVFAATGFLHFDWTTLTTDGLAPTDAGYGAILPGTALVFVSFLGYAKIATVAEELKNPGRNLPIAVIGSVAVVTMIYAVLVATMVGIVPWHSLDDSVPVSQVAEITFAGIPVLDAIGVTLISLAAMLATASSANASILSSARINFAMGRDKIVTDKLNEIHPQYATPYRSILLTGSVIIVFIVALGQDLEILAKAASVLHLIVYGLMNLALIAFRQADVPEYEPDFRVPFYPVTPILGTVFSFGLIAFMDPIEIGLSLAFVAVAVLWYALYARSKTPRRVSSGSTSSIGPRRCPTSRSRRPLRPVPTRQTNTACWCRCRTPDRTTAHLARQRARRRTRRRGSRGPHRAGPRSNAAGSRCRADRSDRRRIRETARASTRTRRRAGCDDRDDDDRLPSLVRGGVRRRSPVRRRSGRDGLGCGPAVGDGTRRTAARRTRPRSPV